MKIKSIIIFIFLFLSQFSFLVGSANAIDLDYVNPYCVRGEPDSGINTALGCISTKVEVGSGQDTFFSRIIQVAVGLGGGLALILMLFGVFIITTSAGIPDKLKQGQEIITSAISGLIFIILSVFLLRLIGVNILSLPGLK